MKFKILMALLPLFSTSLFAQEEILRVGLSGLDLQPRIGIPLAGYGSPERRLPKYLDWGGNHPDSTLFKPSEGQHSPIRAKTMAIKKGNRHLIFISLDLIGVEHDLVEDIAKNLKKYGIEEKDLVVTATHTHGGPGTISRRIPLQLIAVDFFKKKNYLELLNKITKSVEDALHSMVPAELYKSSAIIRGVQRNKWRKKDEEHFDKKATFILAKSKLDHQWLGGIVNFSIHGGSMPIGLMLYSSDVNGAIEHKLEAMLAGKNGISNRPPIMLFLNGAEGDVGGHGGRSVEAVEDLAQRFADQSRDALNDQRVSLIKPDFFSTKKKVYVGFPGSPVKYCGAGFAKKLPSWLKVSLFPFMPTSSYLSLIQLGDVTFFTWPGEPSTQLGYDLQAMARSLGATDPLVVGLANDYMSYFTTKSEYNEGTYDSCSSLYGWKGGSRIIDAHKELMNKFSKDIKQVK